MNIYILPVVCKCLPLRDHQKLDYIHWNQTYLFLIQFTKQNSPVRAVGGGQTPTTAGCFFSSDRCDGGIVYISVFHKSQTKLICIYRNANKI
jgi:hypothetical protein